jgi:predicted transcriptional regulator
MSDEQAIPLTRASQLRAESQRARALLNARESGLLAIVWQGGDVHAGYVASALGLTPQGANNALMRLVHVGFLERDAETINGGGRAYIYRRVKGGSSE